METTLPLQRPLDCKGAAIKSTHFGNVPILGCFSVFLESKGLVRIRAKARMRANSDYTRRHPRRSAIPEIKFSAPSGFDSIRQVGTKTHKIDPHHEEEQSVSSLSSKNFLSTMHLSEVVGDDRAESGVSDTIVQPSSNVMRPTKALDEVEASAQGNDYVEPVELHDCKDLGDVMKQKFEMDAQMPRKLLANLAEESFSSGRKFFVFPEIIRANQVFEVFFNRSLSVLANEPDVLIKGAFNGWRWRSFTEKMHKSVLHGDWWSCKVYVPREAYRIDFVFSNGVDVYENNNQKDFSVAVEGGMDEALFEDFLLEELQKKLRRLAAEQAEKDRKAEEKRRMEAERIAIEADRAQARLEVKKRQEACQRVKRLAVESVQGLWHMKWDLFKGKNRIRLYYNRRSRPLEYSKDLWIHGGYNNWIEGLCIVERLTNSEEKDGDWWYANVTVPDNALILDWVFADGHKRQKCTITIESGFPSSISKVSKKNTG
ncbi:hypothetical protein HPP92_011145 [Vanilla planifolia]|uniref:starch synthase n=1 Tax=Vanilla planifolia TaxID=51239 RepID=A0A835R528_VANPL|nr:hypothetical protein HPP92_011145 [Vanilla planifolia]